MKSLHIVRKANDPLAMEAIQNEQQQSSVAILLLQDGVLSKGPFPDDTYICREDLTARGIKSRYRPVNYDAIAQLIADHDRIVTW
jgi:sulfur relay protein TusB/DsrH